MTVSRAACDIEVLDSLSGAGFLGVLQGSVILAPPLGSHFLVAAAATVDGCIIAGGVFRGYQGQLLQSVWVGGVGSKACCGLSLKGTRWAQVQGSGSGACGGRDRAGTRTCLL